MGEVSFSSFDFMQKAVAKCQMYIIPFAPVPCTIFVSLFIKFPLELMPFKTIRHVSLIIDFSVAVTRIETSSLAVSPLESQTFL